LFRVHPVFVSSPLRKQSNPRKQRITVHPNVVLPNHSIGPQGIKPSLMTETKSVQTEKVKHASPLFFDEGTQCVEEKLPQKTQGVQTSPYNYRHSNSMKQCLGQSLTSEIPESIPPTKTTTVSTSQLTTDTVTLIASTAAAAAVAASVSLHGNNTHTKVCTYIENTVKKFALIFNIFYSLFVNHCLLNLVMIRNHDIFSCVLI